ncbi:rhodanese-like domain-containing protein [Agromyces sp. H3Y2-19a]|uniref:rhodanese-like domain-containing protein n=1 Tax=Agromyces TaxID=33877 RepID=UPI001E2FB83F|nr:MULTISPECIES: rhodanese-like domain-containing protein [Agromyces]MCD5346491.1 rhodanese-like domain-containing protein [Agromyces sp. S2-1-8]MDF0512854.1 rhodanese-like domain-containing protein [Agromyces chromiiresistens]
MTDTITTSSIFRTAADSESAIRHFEGRLAFETDVSDVAAELAAGAPGFVLVDTRNEAAWAQGRVPGAVHLPGRRIAGEAAALVPSGVPVVVYCWGPACNGATRAALEFARLGHPVKEMIGGFEYWVREGFAYETDEGLAQRVPDPLTNVASAGLAGSPVTAAEAAGITCAC